jgi:hypothetical protein
MFGITKPNADIETITSPIHLKAGNQTKEDLIIFLGGTKDISRNEAKKGLRSLRDFTQRTINAWQQPHNPSPHTRYITMYHHVASTQRTAYVNSVF